jgi:FkbM family methyltransferase
MNSLMARFWNASPASISRSVKRRWAERNLKAGWARIKGGILQGTELFLPPSGVVWLEMLEGHYDQFLFDALLARHDPRGKMFWDIGAHVGYHSLAFAALGAEVLAFEPNAVNVARLELNVGRNQKLAPHIRHLAVAVSDADGETTFKHSDDLRGESMGGHLDRALPPASPEAYQRFKAAVVPTIRIDTLLEKRGERPPDIIKIDVEGAEELVLQGGANYLSRRPPVLLMEIHHICLMFSIQRLLLGWGYSTRLLDESHASPSRCFIIAEP